MPSILMLVIEGNNSHNAYRRSSDAQIYRITKALKTNKQQKKTLKPDVQISCIPFRLHLKKADIIIVL